MSTSVSRCLALACVMTGLFIAPVAAQSFKWWQSDRFQRELVLSTEQTGRLEEIYQAAAPALSAQKTRLEILQTELSKLVAEGRADESVAADLIARVEGARADLGRTRALMLYRMRRILTSDQHVKLKVLFAEHESDRQGHSRPKPKQ